MPSKAVHRTVLDDICGRIKWLERAVFKLQNNKLRGIPVYDAYHLPHDMPNGLLFFAIDTGQFGMVIDDTIYYADTEITPIP